MKCLRDSYPGQMLNNIYISEKNLLKEYSKVSIFIQAADENKIYCYGSTWVNANNMSLLLGKYYILLAVQIADS